MLRALLFVVSFVKLFPNSFISMKLVSSFLSVAVAATLLLGGCKGKDGDPGPAGATGAPGTAGAPGPTGQNLTGNITGFVNPVDEFGSPVAKAGVTVTVDNLTPAVSATTDVDGRYTLLNVPSGTYNLTYSRPGLATFKRFAFGHIGGAVASYLGTFTLSQVSQLLVGLSASTFANSNINIGLSFSSAPPRTSFPVALFASLSPNLTPLTGTPLVVTNFTTTPATTNYQAAFSVGRANLNNAGFPSGSTIYLAAYGSTSSTSAYVDPATGRVVYPALNPVPSNVVAVTVP